MKNYCKIHIQLLIVVTMLFMLCCEKRKWNNKYDKNTTVSPDAWKPKELAIEQLSIKQIKLTWQQEDSDISGFKIDKKVGENEWQTGFTILDKEAREYIDTTAPPGLNQAITFRISA